MVFLKEAFIFPVKFETLCKGIMNIEQFKRDLYYLYCIKRRFLDVNTYICVEINPYI